MIRSLTTALLLCLAAPAAFAQAAATAPTNPDYAAQVARLASGLNGFTGTVEPIVTPLTVAMTPVAYD